MSIPPHMTEDERIFWELANPIHRTTLQKLSDARAALRHIRDHVDSLTLLPTGARSVARAVLNGLPIPEPATKLATSAPVAVPADDVGRCAICAWPLAKDGLVSQGCVRGNCSFRGEPPIRPEQRYAPARAEIEAAASRAGVKT